MAGIIKTFTYGRVIIAITRDDQFHLQTTIHRSDKLAGDHEWTNGPFEEDDLPDLVVAIGAAYKYVRRDDGTMQLPRARGMRQQNKPTSRAEQFPAQNGHKRAATTQEALSLRRIP